MDDVSAQETKPQPRVTALVVSYNNVEALRLCLAALERSQERETMELMVVDKGSRDGSESIDSEFPNITMLRLPRNFGTTKALNVGMRTASAELVFFLVPEVEVQPGTIVQLANHLDAEPDAVAVCPLLDADQFFRLPGPGLDTTFEPVRVAPDSSADAVPVEAATFDAMMARKYFIRGINFLDEKYGEYWADADLCFHIRRSGKKVLALPRVTCAFTSRELEFHPNALKVLEADRMAGAARYFGKHYGFLSGIMIRLKAIFGALFSFRIGLFTALVSGRKVDGTQTEL